MFQNREEGEHTDIYMCYITNAAGKTKDEEAESVVINLGGKSCDTNLPAYRIAVAYLLCF